MKKAVIVGGGKLGKTTYRKLVDKELAKRKSDSLTSTDKAKVEADKIKARRLAMKAREASYKRK